MQGTAIARSLQRAPGPLLPEEILTLMQADSPGLGLATVYRTLRRLEDEATVRSVTLPDGRTRYELRDDHHRHFHCQECGRVFDLEGCALDASHIEVDLPEGFRVISHEIVLDGVCSKCSKAG